MTLSTGGIDMTTAGGFLFDVGTPGQIVDQSECTIDSKINNRATFLVAGTTDATAAGLYGSGTLDTKTLIINGTTITFAAGGNAATMAAALAAITAMAATTTGTGAIVAQISGATNNRLVITSTLHIIIGAGTANAVLGLTAGTYEVLGVAPIEFGVAVAMSPQGDGYCSAPLVDSDVLWGISVRQPFARAQLVGGSGNIDYSQANPVGILRLGFIYARAAENVTRGDQVLSLTQGNTTIAVPGALAGVTGGAAGQGRVAVRGNYWETTTAANKVGKIRALQ